MTAAEKVRAALVDPVTLAGLRAAGFSGGDKSLRISLAEYGLAWAPTGDGASVCYIYGVANPNGEYTTFATADMDHDVSPDKEWSWIKDWPAVESFMGCARTECTRPQLVSSLLSYYGYHNVFDSNPYAWPIGGLDE